MIFLHTITLALLCGYGLLLAYYHRSFTLLKEADPVPASFKPSTTISVLIPARNEELKIAATIQSVLAQQYPAQLFQCIIIDDHSEDNTAAIVASYTDPRLILLNLKDHLPAGAINAYKKKSIETGIEMASGELILTTDADCLVPENWLRNFAYCFEIKEAAFIAGPVKMLPAKGLLSIFQSLDFLSLQGITAASAYKGFHSMCNGANLAYTKKSFHSVSGFTGIDSIASGDDMLLMYKIAQQFPGKVSYLKTKAAIVSTEPAGSLKAFLQQRIRWASKAQAYEDKTVFRVLLLVYLLNLLLFLNMGLAFFSSQQLIWVLILMGIKTLLEWPFMFSVSRFYSETRLMKFFPFFQPLHILYTVIAGSFGQFGTYEWKGRRVR